MLTLFENHFTPAQGEKRFGVILANLGTPKTPETADVRKFLRQFLSDTRVVELPKPLWWLILNGIILVIRPRKSAEAYREIWDDAGSPLVLNSNQQVEALARHLSDQGIDNAEVRCVMRYGEPSAATVLREFGKLGVDRVFVLPMYPQYSGSTTGSVLDDFGSVLRKIRRVPSFRFTNHYADHPGYIESLATSVRDHWLRHGQSQKLVLSFHGVPKDFVSKGDPYKDHCVTTAGLLARALQLSDEQWTMCFQSRFGAQEWLKPYADDVLAALPQQGCSSIDIMCPGFAVDCLETLEEVAMGYRELFIESGGETYNYIPCLNAHPQHIEFLGQIVTESVSDWLHR